MRRAAQWLPLDAVAAWRQRHVRGVAGQPRRCRGHRSCSLATRLPRSGGGRREWLCNKQEQKRGSRAEVAGAGATEAPLGDGVDWAASARRWSLWLRLPHSHSCGAGPSRCRWAHVARHGLMARAGGPWVAATGTPRAARAVSRLEMPEGGCGRSGELWPGRAAEGQLRDSPGVQHTVLRERRVIDAARRRTAPTGCFVRRWWTWG
jgi:hypothetical protein